MKKLVCCFLFILLFSNVALAYAPYPARVETLNNGSEIHKIYELSGDESPDMIPNENFEQSGYEYELKDIIKAEIPEFETKQFVEPVTVESKSSKIEDILPLIPASKDVITEDGFSGTLELDVSTIQIDSKGTGTSSYDITATRTYPNLAGADLQYIPKTTVENGTTLRFASVEWQSGNTANVDDYEVTNRYTAVVTYSGTITRSYNKGYIVTAEYKGNVSKIDNSKSQYTAIFEGVPIEVNEDIKIITTEPAEINFKYIILPLSGAAVVLIAFAIYKILKEKGVKSNEISINEKCSNKENDEGISIDSSDVSNSNGDMFPGIRP